MSEKNKKNKKSTQPFPIYQVTITVRNDGAVNVANFPENYEQTMIILSAAQDAVVRHFFEGIADNRYDTNGVLIERKGSDIIIAKPNQMPV